MNISLKCFDNHKTLAALTLGAVALTSVACGSVLNDLENAAGREVGKALTSNSNSNNSSGTSGSHATPPPSTPAPSGGSSGGGNVSMGSSGASSSGSCLMNNADGTTMMCTEFANIPAEASEMFQHNACLGGNSKWSEAKCPTEGRKGGCKSKADEKGAYAIMWQYMPNMARAARDGCVKDAANTWLP